VRRKKVKITKKTFGKYYDEELDGYMVGEYLVQEWSVGEKEDIIEMSASQSYDKDEEAFDIQMNSAEYKILQFLACLKKAPFEITRESIRGLPASIGDKLFAAISEVNTLEDEDETKK
jgi:hypothetical protein